MRISEPRRRKIEARKEKAYKLYLDGYTTREIGKVLGYSHVWAANSINEIRAKEDLSTTKN